MALLPDGRIVASSLNRLRVVDLVAETVTELGRFSGDRVYALTVLPDGQVAVAGLCEVGRGSKIELWDVADRSMVGILEGHTASVYCLAALHSGHLASGDMDGIIRVWNVSARVCICVAGRRIDESMKWVLCLFTDGRRLYSGIKNKRMYIWSLDDPSSLRLESVIRDEAEWSSYFGSKADSSFAKLAIESPTSAKRVQKMVEAVLPHIFTFPSYLCVLNSIAMLPDGRCAIGALGKLALVQECAEGAPA